MVLLYNCYTQLYKTSALTRTWSLYNLLQSKAEKYAAILQRNYGKCSSVANSHFSKLSSLFQNSPQLSSATDQQNSHPKHCHTNATKHPIHISGSALRPHNTTPQHLCLNKKTLSLAYNNTNQQAALQCRSPLSFSIYLAQTQLHYWIVLLYSVHHK